MARDAVAIRLRRQREAGRAGASVLLLHMLGIDPNNVVRNDGALDVIGGRLVWDEYHRDDTGRRHIYRHGPERGLAAVVVARSRRIPASLAQAYRRTLAQFAEPTPPPRPGRPRTNRGDTP
jgi:hypothetical protein